MKVTVSLPAELVESVDHEAMERGSNRSAVLARVLRDWYERSLTERINAHLRNHPLSAEEEDLERSLAGDVAEVLD
jgi:metal-responsive CopG/Arc/MetJ family transcriptional regulator